MARLWTEKMIKMGLAITNTDLDGAFILIMNDLDDHIKHCTDDTDLVFYMQIIDEKVKRVKNLVIEAFNLGMITENECLYGLRRCAYYSDELWNRYYGVIQD